MLRPFPRLWTSLELAVTGEGRPHTAWSQLLRALRDGGWEGPGGLVQPSPCKQLPSTPAAACGCAHLATRVPSVMGGPG